MHGATYPTSTACRVFIVGFILSRDDFIPDVFLPIFSPLFPEGYGILGGQIGIDIGLSPSTSVFPCPYIPAVLHTRVSFISHPRDIILAFDSVVQQNSLSLSFSR